METRVSKIGPEHIGKEVQSPYGGEWKKVLAVDGDSIWLLNIAANNRGSYEATDWMIRDPEPVDKKPSEKYWDKIKLYPHVETTPAHGIILDLLDEQWNKTHSPTEKKV